MQLLGKIRIVGAILIALSVVVVFDRSARGEEITLHDGQKITGTVVGFENGMFRIETAFGFALVRKDKVKSISFDAASPVKTDGRKDSEPTPMASPAPSSSGTTPPPPKLVVAAKPTPPPPPPVSRPLEVPLPAEIHGHLEGTTYVNDTFEFSFYKPPGWKIHADAARETGHAIVAIGSENERTVLFIDRQVWSGKPDLNSDATEANLRRTYQEFQVLDEAPIQLAGQPAVRREFRGLLDGAEWRGISARVARGSTVFGLIGLTSAETLDFYQAVLNKIINSFHLLNSNQETVVNR